MGEAQTNQPRKWPWQIPWVHALLVGCVLLLLVAGGIEGYRRMQRYSAAELHARMAKAGVQIELVPQPAWMDQALMRELLKEAQAFAAETVAAKPAGGRGQPAIYNYERLRDPLRDADVGGEHKPVLEELCDYYMKRQAEHFNAWIKRVVSVQRIYDAKRNEQRIRITAEYRKPVAFIAQGSSYYLVDVEEVKEGETTKLQAIRLPGEYTEANYKAMVGKAFPGATNALLMVRGVEEGVPKPGETWTSADALAGLALAKVLAEQPYAGQIAAIDVSNHSGRVEKMAPHIMLDTVYETKVWWGRALGDEWLYEVRAPAKLRVLGMIFTRFGRIDARSPYVDIRLEEARIPKMANGTTQPEAEEAPARKPAG